MKLLILLLFTIILVVNCKDEYKKSFDPCKHGSYDFYGFKNSSSYQYQYKDGFNEYNLIWNVCGGSSKCNNPIRESVCEIRNKNYEYKTLGNVDRISFSELKSGNKQEREGGIITYTSMNRYECPNHQSTVHISLFCERFQKNRVLSVHHDPRTCETNIHMLGDSACPILLKSIYIQIAVILVGLLLLIILLSAVCYVLHLLQKQYHQRKRQLEEQKHNLLINGESSYTPGNDDIENNWK